MGYRWFLRLCRLAEAMLYQHSDPLPNRIHCAAPSHQCSTNPTSGHILMSEPIDRRMARFWTHGTRKLGTKCRTSVAIAASSPYLNDAFRYPGSLAVRVLARRKNVCKGHRLRLSPTMIMLLSSPIALFAHGRIAMLLQPILNVIRWEF